MPEASTKGCRNVVLARGSLPEVLWVTTVAPLTYFEGTWGHLGGLWGTRWGVSGALWGLLGALWGVLGALWKFLEARWKLSGVLLGTLGVPGGAFWGTGGTIWGYVGTLGAGASCVPHGGPFWALWNSRSPIRVTIFGVEV